MLLEFCLEKELCVSNAWLKREEKMKLTLRIGEIDFVLIKKEPVVYTKYEGNPWKVSTCLSDSRYRYNENKESIEKTCAERRKISLLKDGNMWELFEEKITELVDVGAPNMWGTLRMEI